MNELKEVELSNKIQRILRCYGHVMRKSGGKVCRRVLYSDVGGRREG